MCGGCRLDVNKKGVAILENTNANGDLPIEILSDTDCSDWEGKFTSIMVIASTRAFHAFIANGPVKSRTRRYLSKINLTFEKFEACNCFDFE